MGLGWGELIESLLYRRRFRGRTLVCNVSSRNRVPVLKSLFLPTADLPARDTSSDGIKRECILPVISEEARRGVIRLKSVRLLSIPEGSRNLHIAEKTAFFVVLRCNDPAHAICPSTAWHYDPGPRFGARCSFNGESILTSWTSN
jgi:hypothetical protein